MIGDCAAGLLDHATSEFARGSKLGIDAAKKIPGEGFKRAWPPLEKMSEDVAEYRRGNLAAAENALAQIPNDHSFRGISATHFYRAMIAIRESRLDDAHRLMNVGEALMLPLPVDDRAPLDSRSDHDDLINWLAYREARAMLGIELD